ncbi:ABC transporter permease [Marinomonas sp. 2405UD68-3]|uniref:ABC transporter permease n=1 Tax=Marinomonas sp. 2405UD68-3 TaxID=3391835 RepID=UPI0039C90D5D
MLAIMHSLFLYRHFILSSIRNELVTKFVRSKLGGLWIIINPLSQVAIYALILSNVLAAKLPNIESTYAYAIYLMAGLLAWNLFNEILGRCLNLFIENGNLMKKMSFPKITLPTIVLGSSVLNNALLFIAMMFIFAILGHSFNWVLLWLIPLTLLLATFSLSFGLILGIFNVFLRDIGQIIPIVLQVWFWFTPIVYPISIIPEKYHQLLMILNPMYPITSAYQTIIVYGKTPELKNGLVIITIISLALLILSLFLFRRATEEMVDVL